MVEEATLKTHDVRVTRSVVLISFSALLLLLPEISILNNTGWDCELREDDYEAGKEPALTCAKGKVKAYDFFDLQACTDENHGTASGKQERVNTGATNSIVKKVEIIDSYNVYDHCTAPAYIFGSSRRTYSAKDFGMYHKSGYLGRKDRLVGGARLSMSIRFWLPMTGLFMSPVYILLLVIHKVFGVRNSTLLALMDLVGFLTVFFCGLYIISALSTLYHMRECVAPAYLAEESGANLGHMFVSDYDDPESKGGEAVSWTHETKFFGTQNKDCGQTSGHALSVALDDDPKKFCCNNSLAHFVNPTPGEFFKETSGIHGQTYVMCIFFSLLLFLLPIVSNAQKNFNGMAVSDTIGAMFILAAAICFLIFAFTGITENRCGPAGDQVASLGTGSGDGDLSPGAMTLILIASFMLLVYAIGNGLRCMRHVKGGMAGEKAENMSFMGITTLENMVSSFEGLSFSAGTALFVAYSLSMVIGLNGTDLCDPVYADHSSLEHLVDYILLFFYLYTLLFVLAGLSVLERLKDLPVVGPFYANLENMTMDLFSSAFGSGKSPGSSGMGYAMAQGMNNTTIKLTTFN